MLVRLPCKVGDEIYWFWKEDDEIKESTVLYFYYDDDGLGVSIDWHDGHMGHIGDNATHYIALTREAAEKALNKMKEKQP